MVGRPGRLKSKGSEASTSQDGETPKTTRLGKRLQGRPRKSVDSISPWGSRDSTPFSPANPPPLKRTTRGEASLINRIEEFDEEEDLRSHRLARFIEENPECREEYAKLIAERPSFPPWMHEKDTIEYDGTVYQTGDIVCLFDTEDGMEGVDDPFYAQVRSLIHDQFMRPYAWLTWLAPSITAPDPHDFEPEHFVHAFADHKLYELDSLRWECERPDLPSYQNSDEPRGAIDKARMDQMRERRLELFKAVNFEVEQSKHLDVVRAGDVKLAHTDEHKEELEEILKEMQERGEARRAEMERRRAAGEVSDKEKEKNEYKPYSTHLVNKSLRSDSGEESDDAGEGKEEAEGMKEEEEEEDDDEEDEEEEEEEGESPVKRARTTSQTSATSKGTVESASSSATKPMEEVDDDLD